MSGKQRHVLVSARARGSEGCNDMSVHPRVEAAITDIREIGWRFTEHRNSLAAGGLAYFVALAVAPAAIVIGALTGLLLGPDQVREAMNSLAAQAPVEAGALKPVTDSLVAATEHSSVGGVTTTSLVGVLVAIYAASKVVYGLRLALDGVFESTAKRRGLIGRVIATLITLIGMVVVVGAFVALTVLPKILYWLGFAEVRVFSGIGLVDWVVGALLIWLATRWVMQHAPNNPRRVPWRALGPIVTTIWLLLVSAGLGVYANFSTTLGSAIAVFGGVVVFLLWFYVGFLGLLVGAEIGAQRQRKSDFAKKS
jgi:membrane protein